MELKPVFQSPYDDCGHETTMCRDLNGHPFTIIRAITEADATHDAEVLPMYVIDIAGTQIEAWPEEIFTDG
jgi:hypothetical protein